MIVFVHGNPETAAVWDPLVEALDRPHGEIVRLSPPGFGAPLPDGFGATVGEYRDWLIGELEALSRPIDLVGHDWGGGHVLNAVMARPELVRSWVSDVVGLYDPDYVWHDLAQVWQTEGAGEQAVAQRFGGDAGRRVKGLLHLGLTPPVAEQIAEGQNEEMGRAMLALYRSAMQPVLAELGRDLEKAAAVPGLAVLPTEDDVVGTDEQRHRAAARAGARVATLEGLGHWWMDEAPERGARMLTEFWASL